MEVKITLKNWEIVRNDKKQTIIKGRYTIINGPIEIAVQSFNEGYGSIELPLPPALMAEAEALTEKIAEAITEYYS